jgi:hypothetical protein
MGCKVDLPGVIMVSSIDTVPSGSVEGGEFFDYMSDSHLHRKDCAPCTQLEQ